MRAKVISEAEGVFVENLFEIIEGISAKNPYCKNLRKKCNEC